MELMSARQAAQVIGVHPSRVRHWIAEGRIAVLRIDGRLLLEEGEVRRFASLPRPAGRPFNPRLTSPWAVRRREALRRKRAAAGD